MHMIEAEKVENCDVGGLSCPLAHRGIGRPQAPRRLSDHLILSLGPLSGHDNDALVDPSGKIRPPELGSSEGAGSFATQAVIERARFALQADAETAPGAWVAGVYPPAFPPLRQPELLVGVVTTAEGNLAGTVVLQHALYHFHREECPERQIVEQFVMRKLVDDCAAMPQNPELCRGWHPVNVIDAEAQRSELSGKPD